MKSKVTTSYSREDGDIIKVYLAEDITKSEESEIIKNVKQAIAFSKEGRVVKKDLIRFMELTRLKL